MSENGKAPGHLVHVNPDGSQRQVSPQEIFQTASLWALHKFARAAGGKVVVDISELDPNATWQIDVQGSVVTLTALDKPPSAATHPSLVRAAASVLDKLPPVRTSIRRQ